MNSTYKVIMKQSLAVPIGSSIFFLAASMAFIMIAFFGMQHSLFMIIYIVPAVLMMTLPVFIPIARIEFDESGIQWITTRLLGLSEKVSFRFEYSEIDEVECARYPFFFTAKETGVIVHSSHLRIVAGGIFFKEDRERMASLLKDLSKKYGFEFNDDAELTKG